MKISFETRVDLGQEMWFMTGNTPTRLFISEIVAYISSCTTGESWYTQLMNKIRNKTVTTDYRFSYRYQAKVEGDYMNHIVDENNGQLVIYQKPLYKSKAELLANL